MPDQRRRPPAREGRHASSAPRIVVAGLLLAVAVVAAAWTVSTYITQQGFPKDMRGNPVLVPQPSEMVRKQTDAVSTRNGLTLRVPSTGLRVPVGELNEVNGIIDPPGFSSAYLVRNYGAPLARAGTGTVFVVMHSCRGGAVCPGNYLINVAAGTSSLKPGADVYVGGLHYHVTGSQKVYKPDVHTQTDIWTNAPGRLVLFTCLQVPAQTESTDNMIITAQLVT